MSVEDVSIFAVFWHKGTLSQAMYVGSVRDLTEQAALEASREDFIA